ncbi:MAG: carbohydrate ABC transporter permease [Spirochaetota bacterium]
MTMTLRKPLTGALLSLLMVALALVFVFPFYWMALTSLKSQGHVYTRPPEWLPTFFTTGNYKEVLAIFPFFRYLGNTAYAAFLSAVGQTLCSAMAAYAFARMRWKGRDAFFLVTISTMIIPTSVFAIPWYLLYWKVGILGTLTPLWLPYWFQHPFIIFLLTQFFRGIPESLSDAARIDGANDYGIFLKIIVPLAKPALFASFLLHFIFMWKNLMIPLMYINNEKFFTLSVGLQTLLGGTVKPPFSQVMAAAFMASLPLVIVFLLFKKWIFTGIAASSLK